MHFGIKQFHTDERGAAALIAIIFFLTGSLIIVSSVATPVLKETRVIRGLEESKQSYALAEGAAEEIVYRLKTGRPVDATETLTVNDVTTTASYTLENEEIDLSVIGDANNRIRKVGVQLVAGDGVAFVYGVQSDVGGIILEEHSQVLGNVYSNGLVIGENKNTITGDVVSAGPSGSITEIHATGTIYANEIYDSIADQDAYYDDIFQNSIAGGALYSGSDDQPTTTLPISDEKIEEWKAVAAAGEIISDPCPYEISSDEVLGPAKIECDVVISGNDNLVLTGTIWIEGSLDIQSNPTISVDASIGGKSLPVIVDDPVDRITGSKVIMRNSPIFEGAPGEEKSYVLVISQNESAENGGTEEAINLKNFVGGKLLVYAKHGEIHLENNADLREVSGYRIRLSNFAQVVYETGLGSQLFDTGPTGGFDINSWKETQ